MRPGTSLFQIEEGPAGYDLPAVTDKVFEKLHKRKEAWLVTAQRNQIDAEHRLHLSMLVEVIKNDLGVFAFFEFNHHTHS